jgi:hypothetical protein
MAVIPSAARDLQVKVLVLDEGFVSGTLTALGLRKAGCTVHVLGAVGGTGRVESRGSIWELAPRVGDPELLPRIRQRTHAFDVVYAVTEPLQDLVNGAQHSKRRTSAMMRDAGLLVPDEADLSDFAVLGFPVVLKGDAGRGGTETFIVDELQTPCFARGDNRVARGDAVIPSVARDLQFGPQFFLQRYIDGPTYLAGGVFDRGRALRFYMARKTVQFPAVTGPAAELLSVEEPALRNAALRAFEVSGVSGIASADFIRDRDGRFWFLELNPRPWGSMAAAADAGVDLFAPLVSLWRGEPVTPDLRFASGIRTATLPLCALSPRMWVSGRAPLALARHLPAATSFAWLEPGLMRHLIGRLARMRVRPALYRGGSGISGEVRLVQMGSHPVPTRTG